jgi:hypothetical protein
MAQSSGARSPQGGGSMTPSQSSSRPLHCSGSGALHRVAVHADAAHAGGDLVVTDAPAAAADAQVLVRHTVAVVVQAVALLGSGTDAIAGAPHAAGAAGALAGRAGAHVAAAGLGGALDAAARQVFVDAAVAVVVELVADLGPGGAGAGVAAHGAIGSGSSRCPSTRQTPSPAVQASPRPSKPSSDLQVAVVVDAVAELERRRPCGGRLRVVAVAGADGLAVAVAIGVILGDERGVRTHVAAHRRDRIAVACRPETGSGFSGQSSQTSPTPSWSRSAWSPLVTAGQLSRASGTRRRRRASPGISQASPTPSASASA